MKGRLLSEYLQNKTKEEKGKKNQITHKLQKMKMKAIFAAMNTFWAVVKINAVKYLGLYGILTHDLCDTGAVLYQLS